MKLKRVLGVISMGLLAIVLSGCAGKYTGGGWIPSAQDATKKATFGGIVSGVDTDGDLFADSYSGQWQYHDKAAGVNFHVDEVQGGVDLGIDPIVLLPIGVFTGHYTAQPASLGEGEVVVALGDLNEDSLFGTGDLVIVTVQTGPFAGYRNTQTVGGGNITLHK